MSDTLEDQIRRAYADGAVGIDYGWKTKLAKMMKNAPLSPSLLEAVQSLRHLLSEDDFEVLEAVIQVLCICMCACVYTYVYGNHTHTHTFHTRTAFDLVALDYTG